MMMLPRFAHGRTETLLEMGAMKRIDAISAFGGIARYSETQQNIIGIRTGARASWLARAGGGIRGLFIQECRARFKQQRSTLRYPKRA